MPWLFVLVVILGVIALGAVLGFVKSLMRLVVAVISGVVIMGAVYVLLEVVLPGYLDSAVQIPGALYPLLGAVCVLSILFRR